MKTHAKDAIRMISSARKMTTPSRVDEPAAKQAAAATGAAVQLPANRAPTSAPPSPSTMPPQRKGAASAIA